MNIEDRRELMISKLADWQETKDPCEQGHVDHGPSDHYGRKIVHSRSAHGFGADWDYDAVVEYIQTATEVGSVIENLPRRGHVPVRGADGRIMAFECEP